MPSRVSPSGFKPLDSTTLFKPLKLGHLELEHRVFQAPLTRMRAPKESDGVWVPGRHANSEMPCAGVPFGLLLDEAIRMVRNFALHVRLEY